MHEVRTTRETGNRAGRAPFRCTNAFRAESVPWKRGCNRHGRFHNESATHPAPFPPVGRFRLVLQHAAAAAAESSFSFLKRDCWPQHGRMGLNAANPALVTMKDPRVRRCGEQPALDQNCARRLVRPAQGETAFPWSISSSFAARSKGGDLCTKESTKNGAASFARRLPSPSGSKSFRCVVISTAEQHNSLGRK